MHVGAGDHIARRTFSCKNSLEVQSFGISLFWSALMHCPRCGQQQVSDQIKFCSRCGFQLGLIAEILAHGGTLPQLAELYSKKSGWFTKKNGVILAALWFISFVMMLPAFFAIAGADDGAGVLAIFGVFTTMMILIISLALLPSSRKKFQLPAGEMPQHGMPAGLHGNVGHGALPPQQTQPAASYIPPEGSWRADTADLARPGSVTEGTTRLLKKDEEAQ